MKHFIFILTLLCSVAGYAQIEVGNNLITGKVDTTRSIQNITFKTRVKVPAQAIVLNLGYQIPIITNALTKANFWSNIVGTKIDFSVDYRRQFHKKVIEKNEIVSVPTCFALGIGVGISFIQKTSYFESFSEKLLNYTDADNNSCNVYLNYNDVKESVLLTYLDFPLYLEIGKPGRIKPGVYGKLGVKASILLGKGFKNEGTYTATGYYPVWDVTLHDIPHLGFYTDAKCYDDNFEHSVSPFVLWGIASVGVNIPFSSFEKNKIAKWILRINANVDYSLTPVSNTPDDPWFKGAAYRLNQLNMLGNKNRIFSAGISVGVIYCL